METEKNSIKTETANDAIRYWEKKRLRYNLIALMGGLLVLVVRLELPNNTNSIKQLGALCFFLFGANIFYTGGWAAEQLMRYYFKTNAWSHQLRRSLFVLGSLFSAFWMFLLMSQLR